MSDDVFSLKDIFPVRDEAEEMTNNNSADENLEKELLTITQDDEITTSYLLVNALLNLLIGKGIIRQSEVNALLLELHQQYRQNKG